MFRAVLLGIECFEVFVTRVEMQAAYRLAVVVVEQDSEIGLRVTVYHAGNVVDFRIKNGPNDIETLHLFFRRNDLVFAFAHRFFRGRCHW